MQKNKITIIVGVACIVVGLVGGFFIGKASGGNKLAGNFASGARQFGARNGSQSGLLVVGQVSAVDAQSVTVTLRDGGSDVIFYSTSTPITKSVEASSSDLAVGQNVIVSGSQNSDGSLTANNVQIRSGNQMPGFGQ